MTRVWLVDGTEQVAFFLHREGLRVTAVDGETGLARLRMDPPDLVVLDLVAGVPAVVETRARFPGPLVVLASREHESTARELGADEVVASPVRPRVLATRIRELLRRKGRASERIEVGALAVDPEARAVTVDGRPIAIEAADFDLLWALARSSGRPVGRAELYRTLRGIDWDGRDRSLDKCMARLRRCLREAAGADPIRTIRGVGYQLG